MDAKQSMSGDGGLLIGGVLDPAEKAADRMADRVMRMPASPSVLHRKCAACEAEDKNVRRTPDGSNAGGLVQTKPAARSAPVAPGSGPAAAPPSTTRAIRSMGTGKPLPRAERAFFEPRFGADLTAVRIHDGPAADRANRAVGARAFALGTDIAFAKGEHRPGTETGRRLLAHELAHALQGRDSRRSDNSDTVLHRLCDGAIGRPSCTTDPAYGRFVPPVPIYRFDRGCDTFVAGEEARLVADVRTHPPGTRFTIHGFASVDGESGFNDRLSCARARAAKDSLTALGPVGPAIDPSHIETTKHGETPGPVRDRRSVTIEPPPVARPIGPVPEVPEPEAGREGGQAPAVAPRSDPYPECAPNPLGSHLPDLGRGHPRLGAGMTMLPCSLTEAAVRASPDWCVDLLPHSNERCYRRIPSSWCGPSDQFCFTQSGCCHSSPDTISPVSTGSPGSGAPCTFDPICAVRHGLQDAH